MASWCSLCGYLSDNQCEWSACYRSKFVVINGWDGRLSIWWGLGLWGSGLKNVCKCRACLQKSILCVTEQVCKSHVRVCPVPIKRPLQFTVCLGANYSQGCIECSNQTQQYLSSHLTIHKNTALLSLSLAGRYLVCSCMTWIQWKQALKRLCVHPVKRWKSLLILSTIIALVLPNYIQLSDKMNHW